MPILIFPMIFGPFKKRELRDNGTKRNGMGQESLLEF
jgi:hypothetical protein